MAAKPLGGVPAPADWSTYKKVPGLVLGFHGCDRSAADLVLSQSSKHLRPSQNDYDWLGDGIYFWEGDPWRALDWANAAQANPGRYKSKVTSPYVIGAILDLGVCCNFLDFDTCSDLQRAYEFISELYDAVDVKLPENELGPDHVLRYRDKIVIKAVEFHVILTHHFHPMLTHPSSSPAGSRCG
jgi:hypothetical protein